MPCHTTSFVDSLVYGVEVFSKYFLFLSFYFPKHFFLTVSSIPNKALNINSHLNENNFVTVNFPGIFTFLSFSFLCFLHSAPPNNTFNVVFVFRGAFGILLHALKYFCILVWLSLYVYLVQASNGI